MDSSGSLDSAFYEEPHSGTVNNVQTTTVIAHFGTNAKAQMLTVPRQEFSTFYIINVKGLPVVKQHCIVQCLMYKVVL